MSAFKVAWRTRNGSAPHPDVIDFIRTRDPAPRAVSKIEWIALAHAGAPPADLSGLPRRHRTAIRSAATPSAVLHALTPEVCLSVRLDPINLTLTCSAVPEVFHYFRLADATLKPLPPDPDPIPFAAGDTYIALTPGAQRITDSADDVRHAIARFLHLRDDFNAGKLAEALLDHLVELAGADELQEDITALVVEAR
jgi:hypothetical protein